MHLSRRPLRLIGPLLVLGLLVAGLTPAQAAARASASGTVTSSSGTPLAGVRVHLSFKSGGFADETFTRADGTWSSTGLAADSYIVDFDPDGVGSGYPFLGEFWDDQPSYETATPLTLNAGQQRTNVDARLARGGRVTGSVGVVDRDYPGDVNVGLYQPTDGGGWGLEAFAIVDAEGDFVLDGVEPGTYRLAARPGSSGGSPYVSRVYPSATTFAAGADVVVTEEHETVVEPLVLPRGGTIAGTVTKGAAATPVADSDVIIQSVVDDGGPQYYWQGRTRADGSYSAPGIDDRSYIVYFAPSGALSGEYFDDSPTYEGATAVRGALGAVTDGIGAVLQKAAVVKGVVSPPSGVSDRATRVVDVTTLDGTVVTSTVATTTGAYSVTVPAGTYRVAFARANGPLTTAAQYYRTAGENNPAAATPVTVAPGEAKTLATTILRKGGTITGRLLSTAGAPLSCDLAAFTTDGHLVSRTARSSASTGAFTIPGVATGGYQVRISGGPACSGSAPRYYDAAAPSHTAAAEGDADTVATKVSGAVAVGTLYFGDLSVFDVVPTPTITGSARVGGTLTATPGDTTPGGSTKTYQWYRGSLAISGATARTYRPVAADRGKNVKVRVVYRQSGYVAASAYSEPQRVS